jgi:hypothetical protein
VVAQNLFISGCRLRLRVEAAFLFGLSDKPDEDSWAEWAGQGYAPMHRARMKAMEEAIYDELGTLT